MPRDPPVISACLPLMVMTASCFALRYARPTNAVFKEPSRLAQVPVKGAMPLPDRHFVEFGPFRVDLGLSRLERGGEVVPVPPAATFCPACGTRLERSALAPAAAPASPDRAGTAVLREVERKNATVLHCGVPGAEGIAERLGAGGMHYLMRRLLEIAAEEVSRLDGV